MKLVLVILALALSSACSVENIVAGRSSTTGMDEPMDSGPPEDAATADAAPPGKPCMNEPDCLIDEYCDRTDCVPQLGVCRPRPKSCPSTYEPVCACDGVTYFNDCLRTVAERAPPIRSIGECGFGGKPCGGGRSCSPGEHCAQEVPDHGPRMCPPNPPGSCWVLPSSCGDPMMGGGRFDPCDGTPLTCMNACQAIASGRPYIETFECFGP